MGAHKCLEKDLTLDRNLGLLKTEYDDNLIAYLIQQDREIRSVVPHFNPHFRFDSCWAQLVNNSFN